MRESVVVVSHRKHHLLSGVAIAALSLPAFAQTPPALPGGGQVTAGQATIGAPAGNALAIDQSSQAAIIGWQSFSIGQGGAVRFNNGTGATLNRVTGNVPSQIDGLLSATGSVYLVNPAGVAVGTGGQVATGGSFIASTQDVSDAEFMAGAAMTFRGASEAGVVNYGRIGSLGGDVALIARQVENHGSITAPNGTAALTAGYEVLMRDAALSDGKFMVKIGGGDTVAKTTGRIRAAEVELRANGGNVYALAGNTGSITKATGVVGKGGRVFLTAGDGAVTVSQKVVARKTASTASGKRVRVGGEIDVLGQAVTLKGALLDVSGAAAGGTIRVGGDWQGGGTRQRAATTTVDSASVLRADAITTGNGGTVAVWSDQKTSFAGTISARGGSEGGNGGNAEVSGKALLEYTGFADLSAAGGAFGTLLLDPYNVIIAGGADSNHTDFTATGNDSVINAATLEAALGSANVTVSTGSGGGQAGDITVAAPITWASSARLTLDAYHSIAIDAPVTIAGAGQLDLVTNNGGSGGTLTFKGGVQFTGTPNSGQSLTINGDAYTLLYGMADLQGINLGLSGNYALAKPLDATGVTGWKPLGTNGAGGVLNGGLGFSGSFTGLGNTISNLTVDIGSYNFSGLFGYANGAISDIGLIDVSVKGRDYVGGLVGAQFGNITQAYVTGNVTGNGQVGGLVGYQGSGTIAQAYAAGAVTGGSQVGGLVGIQFGNITQAYAIGTVTGTIGVGGLVGFQSGGSITQVYATGKVNGTSNVGGLVGYYGGGSITQAYATGAITATGSYVGGLVGQQNGGTITSSYFDSFSTGRAAGNGVGNIVNAAGVTAVTSDPTKSGDADYAYKQSAYSDLTFTTTPGGDGWYMIDGQTRPFGAWEYSTTIANAHQLQLVNMDLDASYRLARNIDLAGEFSRAGVAAPTAAQSAGMWNSGFVPLGTDGASSILNSSHGFDGSFTGQGHAISHLTVDIGSNGFGGLFGGSRGVISDIGLIDVSVKGGASIGGLVGFQSGGSIAQAYVTGAVAGSGSSIGGLVGIQWGSITQAYAADTVTGSSDVGGLVGIQHGTVTQAYATGAVTGSGSSIGGLVGVQGGDIAQAYATGRVTGAGTDVGGLVGHWDSGSINAGYFDTDTTGRAASNGVGNIADAPGVTALSSADGSAFVKASYAGFDGTAWAPPSATAAGGPYYPELFGVSGVVGVDYGNVTVTYGDPLGSLEPVNTYGIGTFNTWTNMPGPGSVASTAAGTYAIEGSGAAAAFTPGGTSRIVHLGTLTIVPAPVPPIDPVWPSSRVVEHVRYVAPKGFFPDPLAEVAAAGAGRMTFSWPFRCARRLLTEDCAGLPHPDNLNFGPWLTVSAN